MSDSEAETGMPTQGWAEGAKRARRMPVLTGPTAARSPRQAGMRRAPSPPGHHRRVRAVPAHVPALPLPVLAHVAHLEPRLGRASPARTRCPPADRPPRTRHRRCSARRARARARMPRVTSRRPDTAPQTERRAPRRPGRARTRPARTPAGARARGRFGRGASARARARAGDAGGPGRARRRRSAYVAELRADNVGRALRKAALAHRAPPVCGEDLERAARVV